MPRPPTRRGLKVIARKGSAFLYLRGTVRGVRIFESAGTDDAGLAEEIRAAREAEIHRSAFHGPAKPKVTFAAATVSYLETEPRPPAMAAALQKLLRFWGAGLHCDDVDQHQIDRAARVVLRPGSAPATKLRQVVTPARAVLSHAARRGWCALPAFERVRSGNSRMEWATPDEAERIVAAAHPRVRPLFLFLFCTGARLGEALELDWSDVDLQHGRALLRQTKNGRDRIAALPPRIVATLASARHKEGNVFLARAGKAYRATGDSRTVPFGGQVRRSWATALKASGVRKALTPHHARHSFASWHYAVHKDLLLLKADGCWASVSQVERYAKLAPEGMAPAIKAFWGTGAGLVQVAGARA